MATNLNISENQERVPLTVGSRGALRSITPDDGSPYYVGARAYVTQTAGGAIVTVIDKEGTTTATILNGQNGADGQDGADGSGIADISKTGSVANVDEYTITYDDGDTEVFYVTNGIDGQDGQDGTDGVDGADGFSPIATVSKVGDTATISITDENGTTTATVTDGQDGQDGQDGRDGVDGQDGYTPIKGVDYFDGQDGADGTDGVDGFSPIATVTKSGDTATISITDANGTTTATVSDGTDGVDGQDGQDGYTPIKGVDYFDGQDGTDGVDGQDGADGVGIASITKTATVGLVDTYTILYTDGSTSTYQVTNGANGSGSVADVWVDGASVLDGDTAKVDLSGKSDVGHTHTKSAITDFPTLATVATSGDYNDLSDKPTIPTQTSQLINNSGYIISPSVPYLTCSTAAGTAAKTTTLVSGVLPTNLGGGFQVIVKFTNSNTIANPTLQIGNLPAKYIKRYGTTAPSTSAVTSWNAGNVILFVYDGTYWQMADWTTTNTTYSTITDAEYQAGTSTSSRLITPARLKGAILYHAPSVVPTDVSDFTNDAGYITSADLPTDLSDLNNDMVVSDFTNDAGYITGYTETDPVFGASAASGISSSDISNWNGKSDFSGSYNDLTDKPTIPTVNNATLTIQKNGSTVKTFTANASSNVTANITVPTDTGDLTNGAGFITGYTETDPIFSASAAHGISSSDISNWNGKSDFSGSYNDLTDKPKGYGASVDITSYTSSSPYTVASDGVFQIFCTYRSNNYIQGYVDGVVLIQASTPASQNAAGNILNCVPVFKGQEIYAVKSSNYSYANFYPYI